MSKDWLPAKDRQIGQVEPELWGRLRRAAGGLERWPLVLLGAPGVGKTCAALCLLDIVGGFYFTAAELAAELIEAQQGRLRTRGQRETVWPERFWRELSSSALVVLDELGGGAARISDHHHGCIKKALDVREARPLVCISNLDLERLEALYGPAIASRLAGGKVLGVGGPDRRFCVS